jgi:hypothetical protein
MVFPLNTPTTDKQRLGAADNSLEGVILIPPASYLQAVRAVLTDIDLDPCSTAIGQKHIDAAGWYKADDAMAALAEPWSGRVFLHPHPNSQIARHQIQKLLRDYLAGRVTAAILLFNKPDWLRAEPLLQSFPHLLHWRRLLHWRYNVATDSLERLYPSFSSCTLYLPARNGNHFDDTVIDAFIKHFRVYGRILIAEDLGDDWQQDALVAFASSHNRRNSIAPLLTEVKLERYSDTPGALAEALHGDG